MVVPFSVCRDAARQDQDFRRAAERRIYRHGNAQDAESSPLLQLRWLRLVVDEGHELVGGDGDLEQATSSFIAELFAERRWVVSGTPTTGDVDDPAIVKSFVSAAKVAQVAETPEVRLGCGSQARYTRRRGRRLRDEEGSFRERSDGAVL